LKKNLGEFISQILIKKEKNQNREKSQNRKKSKQRKKVKIEKNQT
jgi:hypothetical protein